MSGSAVGQVPVDLVLRVMDDGTLRSATYRGEEWAEIYSDARRYLSGDFDVHFQPGAGPNELLLGLKAGLEVGVSAVTLLEVFSRMLKQKAGRYRVTFVDDTTGKSLEWDGESQPDEHFYGLAEKMLKSEGVPLSAHSQEMYPPVDVTPLPAVLSRRPDSWEPPAEDACAYYFRELDRRRQLSDGEGPKQ